MTPEEELRLLTDRIINDDFNFACVMSLYHQAKDINDFADKLKKEFSMWNIDFLELAKMFI